MKKKKMLADFNQTHGRKEGRPRLMEQLMGDAGGWKYEQENLQDYEGFLNNLNKTDLFAHAAKLGVPPLDNRERLHRRLMDDFKRHFEAYCIPASPVPQAKQPSAETIRILGQGR